MNISDVAIQNGSIVSTILMKNKKGNVTLFAFDAGQELSEHTAPFDALVQLVDGRMIVTISGEPHTLSAGDVMILPASQPHALKAEHPTKMILTMIRGEQT